MGKKKKDKKKVSAKKEKYKKFHKEKPDITFKSAELDEAAKEEARAAEDRMERHFRYSKNTRRPSINPRKDKSKR
jgi:hypothetical protein